MTEIYGGDATSFSRAGFVFSAELDVVLAGTNANKSGTIYRGAITYGALDNRDFTL
jgi:hypothetical protein